MDPAIPLARRAAVDDLPLLLELWRSAGLPADDLAPFLTEFQVASTPEGTVTAAIGLMVGGADALLHSEALSAEYEADELRSTLWSRVIILARNQGIQRLWTQETGDFWTASGFVPATFPMETGVPKFVEPGPGWFWCQLFDPVEAKQLVAEQMALWEATRAGEAEELQQRIRNFRTLAVGFAALVVLMMLGFLFYVLRARPDILQKVLRGGR
jgi:N-acetylglutamate synthase-like GNAT family acetyltransferase